ncbi:hypothetical protein F5Y15DRAFT_289278 [Xylariaceae sp. FL0016]|nr:hypothetical protein F5Y15DRAFT_289278 [Xylariaceae sp. FL0016]
MSAHPNSSSVPQVLVPGRNPNRYHDDGPAELAGDSPAPAPHQHPLQSHPITAPVEPAELPSTAPNDQHVAPAPPSTSTPTTSQQFFPPPPPGPPPNIQHTSPSPVESRPSEQQYFPPPPPGPPPSHAHEHQHEHTDEVDGELPSYTEVLAESEGHAPPPVVSDQKPPALPPRPTSSQGQGQYFPPPPVSPSQGQNQYFPPPPASPSQAGPSTAPPHQPPAAAESSGNKSGWSQRLYQWGLKAGVPINKVTNKLGSEAFWPSSMDRECDKAARILKSFCKDGFYTTPSNRPPPSPGHPTSPGPASESKVLCKIPQAAIKNAAGLAIFTTFRTGLHISGAGGSGIVIARLPDGSWSPPSGFLVHTLGAGLMVGLDIYDCVCVLNTPAAVAAFAKPRLSLGGEVAVAAGPVGAGASLESALAKGSSKPVWSYMKSRGFYAGMQADGTVIVQRPGANAAFYGETTETISPERILKGQVKAQQGKDKDGNVRWPEGSRQLIEVLKAAEGRKADDGIIKEVGDHPTPGDLAPAEHGPGKGVGDVKYG